MTAKSFNLTTYFKPSSGILVALFGLLSVGVVMIYSSSAILAERSWGSPYYFLIKHLVLLCVGLVALAFGVKFPYRYYRAWVPVLMVLSFILLLLVLIPGIGTQVGHARRWLRIGPIGFQPAELLKLTLIIWVANFLSRKKEVLGYFSRGILPSLIVTGLFFFLLILQPDFGTAVLITLTLFMMIFVAGVRPSHMLASLTGIGVISVLLVLTKAYRLRRITGFLDPWSDPLDSGFQLIQSLIAYGTGGIFGRDLGNSTQKLFFLPEAHTDFIFSIWAEETGLVGVALVLGLLALFLIKGVEASLFCADDFGRNLAFGITMLLFNQSIFNIAVVAGLLPTKGIPLPFISYGGSALVMNLFMAGILINIAREHHS